MCLMVWRLCLSGVLGMNEVSSEFSLLAMSVSSVYVLLLLNVMEV